VRTLRGSTLALEAEGTVEDAKRIIAEREGELSLPPPPRCLGEIVQSLRHSCMAPSLVRPQLSGGAGKGGAGRATASARENYG
jgi:hypothetical protein